jgi:hypothetical protein
MPSSWSVAVESIGIVPPYLRGAHHLPGLLNERLGDLARIARDPGRSEILGFRFYRCSHFAGA